VRSLATLGDKFFVIPQGRQLVIRFSISPIWSITEKHFQLI
jgi:hypothetical protein